MKKFFRLLILMISVQLFCDLASAQELRKYFITEESAKQFFAYLESIKLTRLDPTTGISETKLTAIGCAITSAEGQRHVGCSWFDNLTLKDQTGYNSSVEALLVLMNTEFGLECDDDATCISTAEKIECKSDQQKYSCWVEFYLIEPREKPDMNAPVPGAIPEEDLDDPVANDPNAPIIDDPNPNPPNEEPPPVVPGPFEPILNPIIHFNLIYFL